MPRKNLSLAVDKMQTIGCKTSGGGHTAPAWGYSAMAVEQLFSNSVEADMGTSFTFAGFAFSFDIRIKDAAGNLVLIPVCRHNSESFSRTAFPTASARIASISAFLAVAAFLLSSCGGGGKFTPGQGNSNVAPVAVAQATPETGDSPLTVTLESNGSYDADGTIVKYQWDFDGNGVWDESFTSPQSVTHEYSAGEYHAKLRVTDNGGKTATAETGLIFSNPAHLYWTFERVDGGPEAGYDAGQWASINIDPISGRPVVVYKGNGRLKVAWRNTSGSWDFDELMLLLQISRTR